MYWKRKAVCLAVITNVLCLGLSRKSYCRDFGKSRIYGREIEVGDESPPPSSSSILGSAVSHSILPDKKVPGLRLPVDVGKRNNDNDNSL